ncbi:MAG: hypothetical protein DRP66_01245 [Planctomycetota bacterium]|nr:MAG: hypothetical protein DRP66_01245 [Planctomycetota bacterium]
MLRRRQNRLVLRRLESNDKGRRSKACGPFFRRGGEFEHLGAPNCFSRSPAGHLNIFLTYEPKTVNLGKTCLTY